MMVNMAILYTLSNDSSEADCETNESIVQKVYVKVNLYIYKELRNILLMLLTCNLVFNMMGNML